MAYQEGVMALEVYQELEQDGQARLSAARLQADELHRLLDALPDAAARAKALQHLAVDFRQLLDGDPHRVATILQNAGIWVHIERQSRDSFDIEIGQG